MIPKLFQVGPLSVYSYGLMLGVAFIFANLILTKEFRRKMMDGNLASTITFICLIGGIGGSKLFYLLENPDEFERGIFKAIFSPAGLTFYGGLIVAALSSLVYLRSRRLSILKVFDTVAPALILAYGIGRIGCLLAGDGDYGTPTKLPWGMTFEHGTAKPSIELREYFRRYPAEDTLYHYSQQSTQIAGKDEFGYITRFDLNVPLHPTPLYETLYSIAICALLWRRRKNWETRTGLMFGAYCILSGGARFLIEFLRLNPLYLGFSLSQWIGLGLVVTGVILVVLARGKKRETIHLKLLTKTDCSLCVTMKATLNAAKDGLGFDYEEIYIRPGDGYFAEFSEKIPVLMLDGRMIAKFRITAEELAVRLNDYRVRHAGETLPGNEPGTSGTT